MQREYFQQIAMEIVRSLGSDAPRAERVQAALYSLGKYCVDESDNSFPSRTLETAQRAFEDGNLTDAVNELSGLFFQHNWEEQ